MLGDGRHVMGVTTLHGDHDLLMLHVSVRIALGVGVGVTSCALRSHMAISSLLTLHGGVRIVRPSLPSELTDPWHGTVRAVAPSLRYHRHRQLELPSEP